MAAALSDLGRLAGVSRSGADDPNAACSRVSRVSATVWPIHAKNSRCVGLAVDRAPGIKSDEHYQQAESDDFEQAKGKPQSDPTQPTG